ncbi:MAG: ABC transporter permease [Clostridiales bacterium]|nr:ABC transporter permease [Clostridiales bacterium]
MSDFFAIFNVALLQNTLRTATPIVLAGMGGLFTDHAGIMNIGMDGMMLIGAFAAVMGSFFFQSALMGVLLAILLGVLLGLFFGLFVIKFKSDEFIIGIALNIFAGGITVFLLRTLTGVKGAFSNGVVGLPSVNIPFLDKIPIIGELLNNNSILVYVSWLLVIVCYLLVYKTPYGFRLRASGEHPKALHTIGVSPNLMKYSASLICGILCCLAGAHLSLGYLTLFSENMSASRGFIAFACIIFGRSNPVKVFLAALLFGFLDALGLRLQNIISANLTPIIPYAATIFALVIAALQARRKSRINELKLNKV